MLGLGSHVKDCDGARQAEQQTSHPSAARTRMSRGRFMVQGDRGSVVLLHVTRQLSISARPGEWIAIAFNAADTIVCWVAGTASIRLRRVAAPQPRSVDAEVHAFYISFEGSENAWETSILLYG